MISGDKTRKEILKFIVGYVNEHGYAPTVREIGSAVNLKSPSSVKSHMDILFRIGCLATEADIGSPRAYRVTEKGKNYDFCG